MFVCVKAILSTFCLFFFSFWTQFVCDLYCMLASWRLEKACCKWSAKFSVKEMANRFFSRVPEGGAVTKGVSEKP